MKNKNRELKEVRKEIRERWIGYFVMFWIGWLYGLYALKGGFKESFLLISIVTIFIIFIIRISDQYRKGK